MKRWFRVVAVAIGVLAWGPAQAQAPGGRVSEVVVQGAQRIDPATVRSYMLIQPGDTVDADRLDRSLKALFATGLFADVTIRRHGDTLVVNVVENPINHRIAFEVNHRIKTEDLSREVELRPRIRSEEHTSELQSLMRRSCAV